MKVDALSVPQVVDVTSSQTLLEAARKMRSEGVGACGVSSDGAFVGIISERDIARAIADEADPQTTVVAAYMTASPDCVTADSDIREAAVAMLDLGVRHLPVVRGTQVVGMISMRDVLLDLTPEAWHQEVLRTVE